MSDDVERPVDSEPLEPVRGGHATHKERAAADRAVRQLLDVLAPEQSIRTHLRRAELVQRYRTANGCILQTATAAISLSWFPDAGESASLGELQLVLWNGVVSRRGSARVVGATVASELVLQPIAPTATTIAWRTTSGERYDAEALAAHCFALLGIEPSEPTEAPVTVVERDGD